MEAIVLDWRYYRLGKRLIIFFNGATHIFTGIEKDEIDDYIKEVIA